MAPHPHVDAPLSGYILIEGRSFRKKIRLNNRETSKKIVAKPSVLATIFTFTKSKYAIYSSITSFSRFFASSVARSSYFFVSS